VPDDDDASEGWCALKSFPHSYEVRLTGGPSGYGLLSTPGIPELRTAPPSEFDGPGDAWSPEHLLLASVQTCFLFTLRAVARASKLDFVSLELEATGTVDRQDGVTRFTEIVLRPRFVVPAGSDHTRALQVLAKSERNCLVTASLSTPVHLQPEIIES
jgi:peroxiredoxin-like protein